GYSCDFAEEGEEAVQMYREAMEQGRRYRAVIMDLTIPGGFGGAQAVRQVLQIDPEAVVIVSSGYAGNDVMANYESYGFRGVLAKPYTMSELSDSLLRAMGN
ncbi:MAG TPA: response regulator, partial [Candidatus Sabulitectum sp.]|nr:response regulator [Candidatus Sabulitectum sp.]